MSRLLYRWLVFVAVPFACAFFLLRALRGHRGEFRGLSQRLGYGPHANAPSIWLHAVSVGEVQAGAALVRALQARYPQTPLTLTTTTGTGAARARALFGDSIDVRFLPFDSTGCVRRFLERVRPKIAIILEKELWPTLYGACAARQIPVLLASATVSARACARYRRFASLFEEVFARGLMVAAQTERDAERFRAMGVAAPRVSTLGNLKFDLALPARLDEHGRALRERFGWQNRLVLVGGSTYEAEEAALLEMQRRLHREGIDIALVLAPRQPTRFNAVAERLQAAGVAFARQSSGAQRERPDVLLLDTLGELMGAYAAADIAFVGGSLVEKIGGHNLIEPAALAVATLSGPNGYNAPDVGAALVAEGALSIVGDDESLIASVRQLATDSAERRRRGELGRAFVERNRGTLLRLLALIEPIISAQPPRPSPTNH